VINDSGDQALPAPRPCLYRSLEEYAELMRASGTPTGLSDELPRESALPVGLPTDNISRRRFLSLVSASTALAAGMTACSRIDRGSIVPYTRRPREIIPGTATYYASTFQESLATHTVLVRTREGRPIHVEGNDEDPISGGKISLRAMADLLGLYDPDRLRGPSMNGEPSSWQKAEDEIAQALTAAQKAGRPVLLVTEAVLSPTRRALISVLKTAFPNLRHAVWEPAVSQSEFLAARALYGEFALPRFRFDRAEVVLSLQSDFLGVDANAPAMIQAFAARRTPAGPKDPMNRLWVIEGAMTLTGANADERLQVRPSRMASLAFSLARSLNETHGVALPAGVSADGLKPFPLAAAARDATVAPAVLEALAADLKKAGKSALVVAGSALPREAHVACHLLNAMLGSEGYTVDAGTVTPDPGLTTFAGMRDLLEEAAGGAFSAAIFWGANPAYTFPQASVWKGAVAKIPMTVRIGLYEDETALDCRWRLPEHHWLEAWGDFAPAAAVLSLRQPVVGALHDTRQAEDIVLSWLHVPGLELPRSYRDYLRARWKKEVYPAESPVPFEIFWNTALHDGVVKREAPPRPPRVLRADAVADALSAAAIKPPAGELELVLAPDAGVYDGRYANNGWLNELPNPVTKSTWSNPLLLSIADAARLGLRDEDEARVSAGSESVDVPVIIQPGQTQGVASLSLGYGRRTGNVAKSVGVNVYPLVDVTSDHSHLRMAVTVVRTGRRRAVPRTQAHSRMEGRDPARSWTRAEYAANMGSESQKNERSLVSLIPAVPYTEHKWGMAIDLSACVGCSACVIACQSENNVPVVGPERVVKGREMHWIRIDRYYEGDPGNPSVIHQPVACQHCDDAPCEVVCPVNATTHSPDGLNQMTYNRCVGTRYCSNNCPYKVRRFNFFDYTSFIEDPLRLAFNPEVTVRPRGVMEKCTFCIQRIQDVRQRAKVEGRPLRDGEILTACSAACPAGAIVFGDMNDPQSKVARISKMNRGYRMLTELGVKPSVTYLADISNPVDRKGQA